MLRACICLGIGGALLVALPVVSSGAAKAPGERFAPNSRRPAPRPRIITDFIPFDAKRKRETGAYARRHYGIDSFTLIGPHVIVEHYTGSESYSSAHNTFVPDTPDSELGELPGLCSQFIVDKDGRIYQQTPISIMCRHTVGLNWTAIGIEHVGTSDGEILANRRQISSSVALTRWLQTYFAIPTANVIGHNESLTSAYHCEHVRALINQTHDDWKRADMIRYRGLLGPGPPGAKRGPGASLTARRCDARLR